MWRSKACAWAAVVLMAMLSPSRSAYASPDDDHPLGEDRRVEGPMASADGRCSMGATALFGVAISGSEQPLACLAILRAGDEKGCWTLVDTSKVRPFPEAFRDRVHDEKPILDDELESDAYAQTLVLAHTTDPAALDAAGRSDLTFVQLFREPAKHRGQIVRIAGRMMRIRRYDDPPEKARTAGVAHIYEGWLFNRDFSANPVCCVFTDLPEGLRVAEGMDDSVRFAGYYFKRYRYKAVDTPKPNQWRDAPLLVGRIVAVLPRSAPTEEWNRSLLPTFIAIVGGTAVFVVLLSLWLRRGDRHVNRRLGAIPRHSFNLPDEPNDTKD